jgi:glutamyl-tRNA synthetase
VKGQGDLLRAAIPHVRERAKTFVEAAESLDFFLRDAPVFDEKATAKFLVAAAKPTLTEMADLVEGVADFTIEGLAAAFATWLEAKGVQIKDVAQSARVALTGRSVSPGLYETIHVLGKARTVERLRAGAARIA